MPELPSPPKTLLLDIDGVLHVGREPVEGAIGALEALREKVGGIRLVTNNHLPLVRRDDRGTP
jgi:ribonucleotide monophosphatase NagD (HAD superfamily)